MDRELIENVIDLSGWNEVYIKLNDPDIKIKINGITTAEFAEKENMPTNGCICLQTHSGDPYGIWYKNILLNQLG